MKKFPNKSIGISTDDKVFPETLKEFHADFKDQYRYAMEELDPSFPELKKKLLVIFLVIILMIQKQGDSSLVC